jgi:hypothetical protein
VLIEKCLEGGHDPGPGVGVGEVGQLRRVARGEHLVEGAFGVAPRTSVDRGPKLAKVGRDACRNRIGEGFGAASKGGLPTYSLVATENVVTCRMR